MVVHPSGARLWDSTLSIALPLSPWRLRWVRARVEAEDGGAVAICTAACTSPVFNGCCADDLWGG